MAYEDSKAIKRSLKGFAEALKFRPGPAPSN